MRRELVVPVVALLVLSVGRLAAEETPGLLGDESDGSRAMPIHLIGLFAEDEDGKKGQQIDPDAEGVMPFSTRWTCGECHTCQSIGAGWHFNAVDANVPPGRPGEPWIYFDSKLGTQVPLSYRAWPGTLRPTAIGLTPFEFTKIFGRHMPGGGPGEVKATDVDGIGKQYVSGRLEINCLACHNAHPGQDQGSPTGYAVQVARGNFRWAAAASCEFADVTGSAADAPVTFDPFMPDPDLKNVPAVTYDKTAFDENGNVLVEIVREVPDHRCYFCHSELVYADGEHTEKWSCDEDIHLAAGLTCVDCHRNGIDHDIIRGYDAEAAESKNSLAAMTSCRGCHLGDEHGNRPEGGRLGAPVPTHAGIPPVHFERLTCTACHSGPWPGEQTVLAKTSRAHRLGTPNVNKDHDVLPHIISPVFATGYDGKIAPHNAVWPAYWASVDANGGVTPVDLKTLDATVGKMLADQTATRAGGWIQLDPNGISKALASLADTVRGKPAYVAGGSLYQIDDAGKLTSQKGHPAAQPYMWPVAHAVRPAAQSLGIGTCDDCHATDAAFFFGDVVVDSPVVADQPVTGQMVEFQDIDATYAWAFAFSFVFRPMLKIVALACCAILAGVLLLYGLKALGAVARFCAGQD